MSSPRFGSIVWATIQPPHGKPKSRPAVIITPTPEIVPGGEVRVIAISTEFNQSPKDVQVELPFDPNRHPVTKLKKRCIAICSWQQTIPVASIEEVKGEVPADEMLQIGVILDRLAGEVE